MSGAANAKRILNGSLRAEILDCQCALAKLFDLTRDFDCDLVEAVALDTPGRDEVAEKAMALDRQLEGELRGFGKMLSRYADSLRGLRKDLGL
jgi:hypothetical protein